MQISTPEVMMALVGATGTEYINDGTATSGDFWRIQATEATVLSSATEVDDTAFGEQITLSDDTFIIGHFTNIQLASGAVIALRLRPA